MFRGRAEEQGMHMMRACFSRASLKAYNICTLVLAEAEAVSMCLTVLLQM